VQNKLNSFDAVVKGAAGVLAGTTVQSLSQSSQSNIVTITYHNHQLVFTLVLSFLSALQNKLNPLMLSSKLQPSYSLPQRTVCAMPEMPAEEEE
jgi:hypothetical protein